MWSAPRALAKKSVEKNMAIKTEDYHWSWPVDELEETASAILLSHDSNAQLTFHSSAKIVFTCHMYFNCAVFKQNVGMGQK